MDFYSVRGGGGGKGKDVLEGKAYVEAEQSQIVGNTNENFFLSFQLGKQPQKEYNNPASIPPPLLGTILP